jgi:DNA-directed RNA polymerase specialized sigma24 family protein
VTGDPVTLWISQLKRGDPVAARKLWDGYFHRLVGLARAKLRGAARRSADEEDVALSAFDSFCRGTGRDQFPRLANRDDLWQLLAMITARKAADLIQHDHRKKRGGGGVLGESALLGPEGACPGLDQAVGREPAPDFAVQMAEECRRLLDQLGDDDLRAVAMWKMEGRTAEEIATLLGCVPRTVERKLRLIRTIWSSEVERSA